VPLNPDGTITLETAGVTSIRVAVTGYWKVPTGTDTGLGLDLLEAPTRLVDTTTSTGTCDNDPCDTLQSNTPVEVAVTGQAGLSSEIMAVMVSVTAINPTGTGVLGVGTTEADLGGGIVVFDPAQHASTTMIIPLTDTGTFTIGSWTQTDVAVDVIGVFKTPTRTWRYEYDTTGMRTAKQLDNTAGTGAEWRKEHTWTASGGLPLLLAEHQGTQSAYVIYGPGGTPIYQINTTGDVQYLHQDHQGSTRLTTNPNGTTRNTITYNAHGEITANTNWWLEQPLAGYTGQYHDPETGYIYLRARHYDPTTGQFTTLDPLVAITEEPYGYVGGNPANGSDPTGLGYDVGAHVLPERGDVSDKGGRCYEPPKKNRGKPKRARHGDRTGWEDDGKNVWVWDPSGHAGPHWDVQHPDGRHTNVSEEGTVIGGRDNFGSDKGKVPAEGRSYLDYPMSTLDYLSAQSYGYSEGVTAGTMAIITGITVILATPLMLLDW